jgi:NADPH-dependent curcumin reductase CurA
VTPAMLATLMGGRVAGMALQPGDLVPGPAVGEVLTAPDGSGLLPGTMVRHDGGWSEHALVPVEGLRRVDADLLPTEAHLSQGWPAYVALTRIAPVRPGDTVFVSGGAGALGSIAGQVARLLGAARVVGSTGSADKAERMVEELGYDRAVLRGTGFRERLAAAAPEGLDVVVDTVGGHQLEVAVTLARPHARFALLGATSAQLSSDPGALAQPVALDPVALVTRRLTLRGMDASDHPDALAEWESRFGAWLRSGAITFPHVVVEGIEASPEALHDTVHGRHLGTVLVRP